SKPSLEAPSRSSCAAGPAGGSTPHGSTGAPPRPPCPLLSLRRRSRSIPLAFFARRGRPGPYPVSTPQPCQLPAFLGGNGLPDEALVSSSRGSCHHECRDDLLEHIARQIAHLAELRTALWNHDAGRRLF